MARTAYEVIRKLENQPQTLPTLEPSETTGNPGGHRQGGRSRASAGAVGSWTVSTEQPDIAAVVAQDGGTGHAADHRHPAHFDRAERRGEIGLQALHAASWTTLKYPAVSDELWIQHLRTNQLDVVALGRGGNEEARLEDYVVSGLVDFDDISYDDHADLIYDLAAQTVRHFRSYLSEDDTRKVLRCYQRDIAQFIHAQMQAHYWEEAAGYEVEDQQGLHRAEAERLYPLRG
ncbi:MAG: hypothetical protein M0C28_06505 [Candidatus Moduliflexus flocculans]|nr:hypothetical protein [Candidatus Moduliflexus flocculans]